MRSEVDFRGQTRLAYDFPSLSTSGQLKRQEGPVLNNSSLPISINNHRVKLVKLLLAVTLNILLSVKVSAMTKSPNFIRAKSNSQSEEGTEDLSQPPRILGLLRL